ncbi:sensor histidine kinase [Youxingia wuxianensis]|uniref:histidine kinase n=1 Tax=Youxingia wuxianensis TaxID=2763678 RepID=A0A926EPW9_9FIRM|nr:PAS domain-containing sensor histidine kinase [Youxingia wuxianensis]MBC8586340.1 PAS domain-containing sensor histidine kinase [Youxingia wuxianensis]
MEQNSAKGFIQNIKSMYQASHIAIAILDGTFRVIWCNDAAKKDHTGIELPDGVLSIMPGFNAEYIKAEIRKNGVFVYKSLGMPYSDFSMTFSPAIVGREDYYCVFFSPISDQGTALQPEGVTRVISTFTNQYRTPLTVIFSMLSLLAHNISCADPSEVDNKCMDYIDTININAYKMLRSCVNISEYTKYTNGLNEMAFSRVNIFKYLSDIFDAARVLLEPLGIPLLYDIPEESVIMVCDTDKLSCALLNIISNASHYTKNGNAIYVKVRNITNNVSVSISDKGLGIPTHIQPRVFEPFFSYDHTGEPFSGNGLGLTVAKQAIACHKGTIALQSICGEGTTVVFTLPVTDDPSLPYAVHCEPVDYLCDKFSKLYIILADVCKCPL